MNRIKMFCCLTVALLMLLTCAWAEDASSRAVSFRPISSAVARMCSFFAMRGLT